MNPHDIHSQARRTKLTTAIALLMPVLALCIAGIVSSTTQSTKEEREFKNTVPDHVPIKVKVKSEQSFKDTKNKNWARELEIEVKNTGTKPIYFM